MKKLNDYGYINVAYLTLKKATVCSENLFFRPRVFYGYLNDKIVKIKAKHPTIFN